MLRNEAVGQAQKIGDDLDLSRAAGARTNAVRRNTKSLRYGRGELRRHELEHDCERTSLLDGERVGEQSACRLDGLALDAVAAQAVDGLRRESDVAHDRNAGANDRFDRLRA